MEIRSLDRANLSAEYGVLTQRLLPWPQLNSPFEGAWAVLEPGAATTPHSHHEFEMFIAVSGTATISSDGKESPFVAGDIAYLPPGETHQIANAGDQDFTMYSVWWDPQMSERFSAAIAEQ
jgi:mannose-6-phosphate isomerase-like protein (cupin superfamily)